MSLSKDRRLSSRSTVTVGEYDVKNYTVLFIIDINLHRLLLAIGSYIWECVTLCPANLQSFLKTDGLYSILDIIEIATYPVRCLYLGMLTDMCDCAFCGPYLCTWRRIDKKKGLMSLFATIWREEEDRIGIKRHADGSITGRILKIKTLTFHEVISLSLPLCC